MQFDRYKIPLWRHTPQSETKKLLAEMLKGFKDAEYDTKVSLARAAWAQDDIRANLMQFLEDSDSIVRFRACFILAVTSQEEPEAIKPFVPKLIELLRDHSYNSQIIRSQAVFALLNAARDDPEVIATAIRHFIHRLADYDECHVKRYWP